MKNTIGMAVLFALCGAASSTHAAGDAPFLGLWERIPVVDASSKVQARPNYIFTDRKLSKPMIFSGLRDDGTNPTILCCAEVRNLTPMNIENIILKYSGDPEAADHLRSVKGWKYIYEAELANERIWTSAVKLIMHANKEPMDGSYMSVPVIGAEFSGKEQVPREFMVANNKVRIQMRFSKDKNRVFYDFIINDEKITFSENAPIPD
jgi:hypothetical protein